MPESKPPLASEFDKARDWRAHQIALLTAHERAEYERIKGEGKKREEAKEKERERTLAQRIEEETRRKLLAKRNMVLELLTSEKARRRDAAAEAGRAVRIADENARKQAALHTTEECDHYLREKDKQRQLLRIATRIEEKQRQRDNSLRRHFNDRSRDRNSGRGRDGR